MFLYARLSSVSDAAVISVMGGLPPNILLLLPSLNSTPWYCKVCDTRMSILIDLCEFGGVPRDGILVVQSHQL